MATLLRALIVLPLWLPLCTQAHMQMTWPFALRSPLDPAVSEQYKDYSITSPLKPDGSDFPCKHYQYNDTNPQAYDIKATYQAGSTYNITLAGVATHSGGSCQISISYDNGLTFKVLQSIIGGCPLAYTYDFTVPSFAPSSDSALLSWSWFNLVGNREMYQNCARVQVQGAPVQRYRRTAYRRQNSLDQLPDLFACNVGNGCTTIERSEVVFPNPGPNVLYGQDAITPNPGPGFIITGSNSTSATSAVIATTTTMVTAPYATWNATSTYGPTGTGYTNYTTALTTSSSYSFETVYVTPSSTSMSSMSSTSANMTSMSSMSTTTPATTSMTSMSSTAATTSSTTPLQFEQVTITITVTITPVLAAPSTTSTASSTTSSTTSSTASSTATSLVARDTTSIRGTLFTTVTVTATSTSATSAGSTPLPSSCTPGQFACNSASTFSQCGPSGTYVFMGNVATGMQCVNGQIIRENAGPCTPNGQIFCNGTNAFYMCDQGGLLNMGPVAPGSVCQNGVIVAA